MKYRLFNKSIIGPKYESKGLNCQDNSFYYDDGKKQAIVVADGHGSKNCFRSDIGSELAVKAAINEIKRYLENDEYDGENDIFSETGISNFKYSFWCEWRRLVKNHWDACFNKETNEGLNDYRYKDVSEEYKDRFESDDTAIVNRYLYTAYGTTLILAISIETQILLLQIGDGSCVVLMDDGSYYSPVPVDENNFLNVVVSLCEENAYKNIRHRIIDRNQTGKQPVGVFLSSDGLDDCFLVYENEKYLYSLYTVVIDNIINKGFESTENEIENSLLPGLTKQGSQDDISLAYMICEDIDVLREAYNKISQDYKKE